MDAAKINKTHLKQLICDAIDGIPTDDGENFNLSQWQYYYELEPEKSFMKTLTLPPVAELVGDVWDDVEFINSKTPYRGELPEVVLERIAPILTLLGVRSRLLEGASKEANTF